MLDHFRAGIVAEAGLFAHGRGEAFDYLIGERTTAAASRASNAAAAALLTAKHPVISVNGNTAALVAKEVVRLADIVGAKIEVNLFYRSVIRELAIEKLLKKAGANEVLGIGKDASARLPEIQSERRRVDPRGILIADVVFIPLEDGDRTQALVQNGKEVVAVDLNPLSRTSRFATITIVDNIVRAMPALVERAEKLKKETGEKLDHIRNSFNNFENLGESLTLMNQRLRQLAESTSVSTTPGLL